MNGTTKITVKGYAASELDIAHEAIESGDWNGRLVSQWDGRHVIVFDPDHADALAAIACDWSNDIDREIDAGAYDDCPATKRQHRAAMVGLSTLATKLRALTA